LSTPSTSSSKSGGRIDDMRLLAQAANRSASPSSPALIIDP
jgi:hypothetical protein